jgi:DnaJ-class molecular chaperone
MTTKRDYYDILGVSKTATEAELKSAYRKKALEFHPDRNKAADADTRFKEVNEAYEVLNNKEKREAYDRFGHSAFDPSAGSPFSGSQAGGSSPFNYTYYNSASPGDFADAFGGFSDPFDIFETFFGRSQGFGGSRAYQQKPHYSLKIDFMDAVNGVEKTFVHQGKQYKVKIPAGADDGTRIRYSEFDVSLNVGTHPTFKRDDADVYIDHEISFIEAILGGKTRVPTLEGKDLQIKIRPGTQPGTVIRLSGKGIKRLQQKSYGDFYIRLVIKLPTRLTNKQKSLIKEFDQSS